MQLDLDSAPECHEIDVVALDSVEVGDDHLSARTSLPQQLIERLRCAGKGSEPTVT
jgi:hypothetical protein